jgi:superfamily II DNA or RNA helicase
VTRQLRPYQRDAVEAVYKRRAAGRRRQAGVAATGLGKSTMAGKVATDSASARRRVLMLAHRGELLDQLTDDTHAVDPGVPIGRVQGQQRNVGCPITVASIDTVRRPGNWPWLGRFDDVIYDEVHHAAAPANMALLRDHLRVFESDGAQLLGLTATLTRSDRYGLGDLFADDDVAFRYGPDWAIASGYLVKPYGKVVVADHVDLNSAKVSRGDYQDGELGEMVAQDAEQIADAWCRTAGPWWWSMGGTGDPVTASFAPSVIAAEAITGAFLAHRCARHPDGVTAETLTGAMPLAQRGSAERGTGLYGRLAAGVTRVMSGVMVHTEGWNCPPAVCCLQARPTRLEGLYQQIVGRVLRPALAADWPVLGGIDKPAALVLDVVGASRHQRLASLVQLDPSAVIDTSELDEAIEALPCETCGEADACRCNVVERDPFGGRRRIEGPQEYEDVDLLLTASDGAWLATRAGHPFLVCGGYAAVIMREPAGTYRAGTVTMRGAIAFAPLSMPGPDGTPVLARGVSLDVARLAAEAWAIGLRPYLANRGAKWRTASARPSLKDQARAIRHGIDPRNLDGRTLSELVDVEIVSGRVDRLGPGAASRRTA